MAQSIRKRFNLPVCTHCYYVALLLILAECLPIQIQTMNRMVRFIQKCFNYTLSQFKLDATTFCNLKPSRFYYIFRNKYQMQLDEKLLNTVSLQKDVLNNIENACNTFLVKNVLGASYDTLDPLSKPWIRPCQCCVCVLCVFVRGVCMRAFICIFVHFH